MPELDEGQAVYFARMGSCVKIGHAVNLKRRMASMSLPMSAVAGTLPGGHHLEMELHQRFQRSRIDGSEWFESTPELEEFLDSIGAMRQALLPPTPPEPAPLPGDIPRRMLHDSVEAAVLLGITERDLWNLVAARKLFALTLLPGVVRFSRQQIDKLLA